jgi:hypothetical protein
VRLDWLLKAGSEVGLIERIAKHTSADVSIIS